MPIYVALKKSRPSKLKRLKFLPRFGLTVDFAGRELHYRHTPILETLINLKGKKPSFAGLMEVALEQFREIDLLKAPKSGPKK